MFVNVRPVGGLWAESLKLRVYGSVLAMWHKMVGWDGDRMSWVWLDGMEVAGGPCIHQHKAGGGV
jgi:hypothetical protein